MTDKVIVWVTCGETAEAEKIALALVEKRLAACVNIIPQVRSFYRWEGKVQEDSESLLLIKTSRTLFEDVRAEVQRLHSYQVPEVICVSIVEGAESYLNWLTDSVKTEQ